jgi:DNA-binding transcriptional regulator of glucitol operon
MEILVVLVAIVVIVVVVALLIGGTDIRRYFRMRKM